MLLPATAEAPSAARAAPDESVPARGETLLLVEDEAAVREVARRVLAGEGYEVIEARDADEALAAARRPEQPIDLLLTDVVMPKMSGTELAYRLAEIRPGVPVLYMSGYTDDVVVRAGVRDGSVPLVEKPFSAQTLSRAVRHALERGSDAAALAA